MATKHEAVLAALHAFVDAALLPTVTRDRTLAGSVPPEGLADMTAAEPQEIDRRLSPDIREISRVVTFSMVVQATDGAARRAAMESRLVELGAAFADQTLGGAVDYADLGMPEDLEDIPVEGAAHTRAVAVPVTLFYETTSNPLEAA